MGCVAMARVGRILTAAMLLLALEGVAMAPAGAASPAAGGQSLYRDGLRASGVPVNATVQKGVVLSGADAACVKCHRRSGLGGSEGQNPIRPIAGRLLFSPGDRERAGRLAWLAGGAPERPTYSRDSLARALRAGIDPSGRTLDPLMPRYDLSDAEVAQLHSYLEGLSATVAPGVSDSEIHFSTIVAGDVSRDRRKALLDVMQGFFRDKNGGTRKEARRREVGNEAMHRAYRTWVLHVWELQGAPETWGRQLEVYYRRQPVFAVIGGIGDGSWQPVHGFCEAFEVPCVFPDVDYPEVAGAGYYPIYFSRGVILEAEVLARHLLDTAPAGDSRTIVQVFRDDARGRLPGQALRQALQGKGADTIVDVPLAAAGRLPADFVSRLTGDARPDSLVLWLDASDLAGLDRAAAPPDGLEAIYVSASMTDMRPPPLGDAWRSRLNMVYPFDLPAPRAARLTRLNAWLRARNIPLADERTQANAFFAATVTGDAVSHLGENFSRDYFIERIEQMTQSALSPSIYPRLSLGPGQRFASQGGYVVRFADDAGGPVAVSDWLVAEPSSPASLSVQRGEPR
jgi:mono/diheme cytochrome c family protein